jgi:hypothetical protein
VVVSGLRLDARAKVVFQPGLQLNGGCMQAEIISVIHSAASPVSSLCGIAVMFAVFLH